MKESQPATVFEQDVCVLRVEALASMKLNQAKYPRWF